MNREQMKDLIEGTTQSLIELNRIKGWDYTQGSDDAFANFKRCGARVGKISDPAFQAWAVYYMKHEDALWTYLEGKEVLDTTEPPEKRIDDMILYLLLLKGEIITRRQSKDITRIPHPAGRTIADDNLDDLTPAESFQKHGGPGRD